MVLRGGRSRFVVESKWFEIEIEESGGALKPVVERWMIKDGLLNGWRVTEKFRMERRLNKAGRFILCSVRDMEAKRYNIIFPEGEGQASGWNSLAVRLRGLGVTPTEGLKISNVPEFPVKPKGVLKGGGVLSQFHYLSWISLGIGPARFGRGKRSIKDNWLILDKWNPEVGCSLKNPIAAETWVRVVGLPFHFWCLEVFKSIGDGCGGFIAVDEGTKSMSELQWARILVKRVDWESLAQFI
ncbi:hypothetical protein CK203_026864 [Vitis vinifera]|uniref:Uncharacterized protein n=1 Tax=Vitis vinifera TaxID=29760 RepID=A0A438IP51_VITVI|nr:hypothetical protein CK203_026864 [Vitis vinifera]